MYMSTDLKPQADKQPAHLKYCSGVACHLTGQELRCDWQALLPLQALRPTGQRVPLWLWPRCLLQAQLQLRETAGAS